MGKIYPEEFREQAVELYRVDEEMTYAQVARDMGCSSESVRAWVEQAEIDEGKREGTTTEEQEKIRELRRKLRRSEKENEILSICDGLLRQGGAVRVYQFIEAEKAADETFSIRLGCEVLQVSRSGFYDWRKRQERPPTDYEGEQARLVEEITLIHEASRGTYGSPRIYAELRDRGWVVGENRVARTMRDHGIVGRSGRRRRHHTTKQAEVQPDIPDLVQRQFTADRPDELWCTDLSYVPTGQGWLYVAVILDVFSRRVVGWQAASHMRTELVLDALRMALGRRSPTPGLIVHSDREVSQFTSDAWLAALDEADALPSMGRVGWCWDNAMAESWFAAFKNELVVPEGPFDNRWTAKKETYRYIRWHNLQRRHSALNMLAPADWERGHRLTRAA